MSAFFPQGMINAATHALRNPKTPHTKVERPATYRMAFFTMDAMDIDDYQDDFRPSELLPSEKQALAFALLGRLFQEHDILLKDEELEVTQARWEDKDNPSVAVEIVFNMPVFVHEPFKIRDAPVIHVAES